MATITANIDADQSVIPVSVSTGDPGTFWMIGSEAIQLLGTSRGPLGRSFLRTYWSVERGIAGTTAASHSSGTTLTQYYPDANSSGGGGSISATDGQIVFMDGADAVGSADLTWTSVEGGTLGLVAAENGSANIAGIGAGVQLNVKAADGDATGVGGELTLQSGSSSGGSGGQLTIQSGSDDGGGDGGGLTIQSGGATGGQSGTIDITVDPGGNSATGGTISILAGTGQTGDGGDVLISAGAKVTGGSHGSIQLYEGSGNNFVELNASGFNVFGGLINFDSLPTADPLVAGQLYTDGAPSAGVPKALMVSGG